MKKHNGSIGFESEGLGHGCNFYFDLPAFRVAHNNLTTEDVTDNVNPLMASRSFDPLPSPLQGRTVLICDDSAMVRKMLKKVLLRMGVNACFEASNGLEAVQMTEDHLKATATATATAATTTATAVSPLLPALDLILLDDRMPVLLGPEAARRIRDLGFANPIIGVTGNLSSEDLNHFLASGASIVLSKPLDISKLEQYLRLQRY